MRYLLGRRDAGVHGPSDSGLFKTLVDALDPDSLNGMPVVVAPRPGRPATRWCSTTRCGRSSRHLRAVVVPTGVFAATEDFGDAGTLGHRVTAGRVQLAALMVDTPTGVGGSRRPRRASAAVRVRRRPPM